MKLTLILLKPTAHTSEYKIQSAVRAHPARTHLIFNQPIYHNEPTQFKLRIRPTSHRYMMVGVVDYVRQEDERESRNSGNAMCYYGIDGTNIRRWLKKQMDSRKAMLSRWMWRAASTVKYIISHTLKATRTNSMLYDSSRVLLRCTAPTMQSSSWQTEIKSKGLIIKKYIR